MSAARRDAASCRRLRRAACSSVAACGGGSDDDESRSTTPRPPRRRPRPSSAPRDGDVGPRRPRPTSRSHRRHGARRGDQPADPRRVERPRRATRCAPPASSSTAGAATRRPGTTTRSATPGTRRRLGVPQHQLRRHRATRSRDFVETNAAAGVADPARRPDARVGRPRRRPRTPARSPTDDGGCLGRQAVGDLRGPRTGRRPDTDQRREHAGDGRRRGSAAWSPRAPTSEFIAMDNEPELWGHTHYDVHPACPTYEEILDKYLDLRRGGPRRRARRRADRAR